MVSRLEYYIDERAVKVWKIMAFLINSFLVFTYGIIWVLFEGIRQPLLIQVGIFGVLCTIFIFTVFVLPKLRRQRWRYAVYAQEIDLHHGVFVTKKTLIPMVRVQHVDVRQGPIMRHYGLASVDITTAATTHVIPAVAYEEAERLRNQLSNLARVATEDV
ncbi:PH domain-containing protein [Bacillus sp. 165]|uniref:PH domain-containing protein n=1 Tax=Bacillus sp. 165 TaxID=1529117 RepID=UPI001FFE280A|nr:PH domain-containing protein [Bacillus sp. 165]